MKLVAMFTLNLVSFYAFANTQPDVVINAEASIEIANKRLYEYSADVFSRKETGPIPVYENDRHAEGNHAYGLYQEHYQEDQIIYTDYDRAEALLLPSPLELEEYKDYNVIVVANKTDFTYEDGTTEKAQTIRVYVRPDHMRFLESYNTFAVPYDEATGLLFYWKMSSARTTAITPPGIFTVQGFSSNHFSSKYPKPKKERKEGERGAPMPWAVFFNGNIASHGILGAGLVSRLGERASAGCLRLEPGRAEDLFHLVGHSGYGDLVKIKSDGTPELDKKSQTKTVQNYKTLFIVKD